MCFAPFQYKSQVYSVGQDARQIKTGLAEQLGVPVFLDSDDLRDLRDLQGQLRRSDVLLFFQTKSVLERPWCLIELYTALSEGIPIVPVQVKGQYPYSFERARRFLDNFEAELGGTWQGEELRQQGFDIAKMGRVLRESLPYIISSQIDTRVNANADAVAGMIGNNTFDPAVPVPAGASGQPWEPAASQEVLAAQLQNLIKAMECALVATNDRDRSAISNPDASGGNQPGPTGADLDEHTQLL